MEIRRRTTVALALAGGLALSACTADVVSSPAKRAPGATQASRTEASRSPAQVIGALMDGINAGLEKQGASYRVGIAEYSTAGDEGIPGGTVISKVLGNRRVGEDFVPFDPRREWSGPVTGASDDITFAIDGADASPPLPATARLTAAQTTAAIERAMQTWDDVSCSTLPLAEVLLPPNFDLGIVAFLNNLGGGPFVVADIMHSGWEIDFGPGVLGVTFTFVWFDDEGQLTDIDHNGRADVAFREIYYSTRYPWRINGGDVDVETVALHESGHGLSEDHFGTISITKDGFLKASPRAVMNAFYGGPLHSLLGPDIGGHCNNWANWPTN